MRRPAGWPAALLAGSDALLILAPFNRIVQEVLTVNYVPFANFLPYALLLTFVLLALFTMKGLYRIPRNAGLLDYAGTLISGTTTGIALGASACW
jgi:hypothetical protein